jgi:poly-gamma-glutamate synthesis protein (capsule biosynthesis protein)
MTNAARTNRVSIAALGDIMLARDVGRHYRETPSDFEMADIRQILAGADLVCANLESPVAIGGRRDPLQDPQVTFRAHPDTLAILKRLRVRVAALGNNHMLDYGEAALVETLEHLDAAGIRRVGAGRNYAEANEPLLLECNGRKLAFLSYALIYSVNTRMATRRSAGISNHRMRIVLPLIRSLRKEGRDVIVLLHWGFEYRFFPLPYQMRQARQMIRAGAAVILGHGPHYPQGFERFDGRDIVYSLGNFIFDEPHKFANRSFIYFTELNGDGPAPRTVVPVHLQQHVPAIVHGPKRRRLERLLEALSRRYQAADSAFWQAHSAAYLTDICGRVIRGRSLKYLRVPPLSFYRDAGPLAIARKIRPGTLLDLTRAFGGAKS